jgi:hypothetical protein
MEISIVKCYREGIDEDNAVVINSNQISRIKPVVDKDNKPALMVDYYDDEYCMNATYFCDYIEQVNTFTI